MSYYFGSRQSYSRAYDKNVIFIMATFFLLSLTSVFIVIFIGSQDLKPQSSNTENHELQFLEFTEIIVPVKNIREGDPLKPEMFQKKKVKTLTLNKGAVTDFSFIYDKYASTQLLADYPIYEDFLTYRKPTYDIRDKIHDGYRAVTIKVDKITSLEGWVEPGAKVDVAAITQVRGELALVPVVNNVQVLSVERSMNSKDQSRNKDPETLTLMVTPLDANRIIIAQASGMLNLTLRNNSDSKPGDTSVIKKSDFIPSAKEENRDPEDEGSVTIEGKEYFIRNGHIVITDK